MGSTDSLATRRVGFPRGLLAAKKPVTTILRLDPIDTWPQNLVVTRPYPAHGKLSNQRVTSMLTNLSSLFAYLDPGTGSIVLQVVAATLISVGVMFRHVFVVAFHRIFRFKRVTVVEPEDERW